MPNNIGGDIEADDGKYRYERVPLGRARHEADDDSGRVSYLRPIHGGSLEGAFKLPHNAIRALGNGDPDAGLAVADEMFGHHLALGRAVVHPDVVRHIGDGDLAAGHRVLRKFVATLRHRG